MAGWPFAGTSPVSRASRNRNVEPKNNFQKPAIASSIAGFSLLTTMKGQKMNVNKIALKAQFGAETRFELQPTQAVLFDAAYEGSFERLKNKLLDGKLRRAGTKWDGPLRDAANEAAAIAWTTSVPSLVFPVLFEEKITAAVSQDKRQTRIFRKSRELLAA
jgi:hypothetical protein